MRDVLGSEKVAKEYGERRKHMTEAIGDYIAYLDEVFDKITRNSIVSIYSGSSDTQDFYTSRPTLCPLSHRY